MIMCLRVCRLAEERMAREGAETRLRLQEDQLAELQEDLRRVSENTPHSDSLQTVLILKHILYTVITALLLMCLSDYL